MTEDKVRIKFYDEARRAVKFVCPHCNLLHVTSIRSETPLRSITSPIKRNCPKTKLDVVFFLSETGVIFGQPVEIPIVPNWDCNECQATGEYVGFNHTERCRSCFGSNQIHKGG